MIKKAHDSGFASPVRGIRVFLSVQSTALGSHGTMPVFCRSRSHVLPILFPASQQETKLSQLHLPSLFRLDAMTLFKAHADHLRLQNQRVVLYSLGNELPDVPLPNNKFSIQHCDTNICCRCCFVSASYLSYVLPLCSIFLRFTHRPY